MNKSIRLPVNQHMVASKKGLPWLALFLGFAIGSAQAQTTNSYTGANNGNWGTATNWSLTTIPSSSDNVFSTNGTQVRVQSGTAAVAGNLTIGGTTGTSSVAVRQDGSGNSLSVGGNITLAPGAGNGQLVLGVGIFGGSGASLTIGDGSGSILDGGGVGLSEIQIYGQLGTLGLASVTVDQLSLNQNSSGSLTIGSGQIYTTGLTILGSGSANVTELLTVNGGTLDTGTLRVGAALASGTNNATLVLNSGTIKSSDIRRSNPQATTFEWNGGTIQNRSGGDLTVQGSTTNILTMSLAGNGTHTFNADSGRTITVATNAILADKSGEQGTLVKAGAGTLNINSTNTYTGGTTVLEGTMNVTGALADDGAVTVDGPSATYTVGANDTVGAVTLKAGTINGSGTLTGSSYNVESGLISAALAGNGALTKSTAGQATLSGSNSFTGGVTVNGGTLKSLGNSAGNTIVVNNGGTLAMAGTDTWGAATTTNTPAITINAGGTMTSDGFFNSIRDLTLNGGTVSLNGGLASAQAFVLGGTVTAGGATPSTIAVASGSNNTIRLGRQGTSESTTFNVTDADGQLSVGTVLDNNFGSISGLTKSGSGKMILASNNIYSGPTTISGGTLQVGNGGTNGTLGAAGTEIAISSGATLSFNRTDNYGGNFTRNLSGAGEIILSSGTLTLANSSNSFTGGLTINGGTLKGLGGAIPAANSVVVNSGGTFGMGTTDTWGSARTTNTPAITVNAGGFLTTDNQFNSLRNLTLNGGTLNLNGGLNATTGALVLGGTVTAGGTAPSSVATTAGSHNFIRLGREGTSESTTFNVTDAAGTLAISAPLTNNFAAISGLIKDGDGTLVLSASNSYTGTTTVNGGSLVISNAAYVATITPTSIQLDYSTPPTVGTNNLLPGPVDASSLASYSVNGNGSTTVTLTNSPNLKAIVTSSAPANQKPVINAGQTFSVAENSAAGTGVGTLTATDADSDPLSGWAIVSGNTDGAFALNSSTGQLTVLGGLNFEAASSYTLSVTVSDGTATSDPVDVTVSVSNVAEFSDVFGSEDPSADSNGDGISNLLAYALGATNSNSVVVRPSSTVNSNNLILTALVRTNDPKLEVRGNATTTLTNWPTNLFAGTPAADQTGAVSGVTQKQDFTVERGTNARQFLRLKATYTP